MSDVTFGVKMPEELKEQITNLIKESGLPGKDFMQSLINTYHIEATKKNMPQVAEDLKELQGITQRINNIYLNLGYRIDNITKVQQEETNKELNKKDSIISNLQDKITEFNLDKEIISEKYNEIVNLNNDYLNRVNELTESNNHIKALIEEYKEKNDMLLGQLKDYEKYKNQIETTKELLAASQDKNITLENSIKENEFTIKKLNNEILDLKEDKEKTVQELKNKHSEEIETTKEKYQLKNDKAIIELQKQYQSNLQDLQDKYNKEIQEYQNNYKQLLEELKTEKEDIKASLQKKTESNEHK